MSLHEDRLRRVTRLFVIASMLQGGGRVTLDDLADACACSRRTITRDLLYLHEADVPYRYDAAQHSYVLAGPLDLLTVQFSLPEILALAVAEGAVVGQEGTPFEAHIRSAFHKVTSLLPAALREEMAAALQTIVFQSGTKRDYGAVPWSELLAAIKARETLEMDYYTISRDELATRCVDPYRVAWRNGYWNLVGYCHRRQEILVFALDGIRALRPTGQTFSLPADFSLEAYLRGSVGLLRGDLIEVVVRFEPPMARWARRRRWEFPHHLTEEPNGALTLHGTVSGLDEIRGEMLRWGRHVTVLEPPALREAILAEAQAIAANYVSSSSATPATNS